MNSNEVPPLGALLNAPITTIDRNKVSEEISQKCFSEDIFRIVFTHYVYILCVGKQTKKATFLFSRDFHVEFSPAKKTEIEHPKLKCARSTYLLQRQKLQKESAIGLFRIFLSKFTEYRFVPLFFCVHFLIFTKINLMKSGGKIHRKKIPFPLLQPNALVFLSMVPGKRDSVNQRQNSRIIGERFMN